jgi:hypothetical protein
MSMPPKSEEGQIIPLVIVYVLIALVLIVVVVDISAVHVQRDRLYAVADAAALDAADALDRSRFYGQSVHAESPRPDSTQTRSEGPTALVPVSDRTVRDSAAAYLRRAGPESRLSDLRVDRPTGTADGVTAEVTVRCRARLPLFSFVVAAWSSGVPLGATARARAERPD